MATEAQRAASARHNTRLQAFHVRFRKDADADVIAWLKGQENVTGTVRKLVRKEIGDVTAVANHSAGTTGAPRPTASS